VAELDDRGRDAADGLLAKVTAVARAEAARAVAEKLNNVVEGGRLNWEMLTQWGHRISDDGVPVPIRPNLDLVGFTVADVPVGDLTRVTGGGGSGLDRCTAKLFGSALTIPTGTLTDVPMDEDEFDPGGWHDEGTSSPTIVVPTGGDYLISYRFFFVTVGTGTYDAGTYRRVHIAVSGGGGGWSHDHYAPPSPAGFLRGFSIVGSYPVTIGTGGVNVKMQVQQDSGVDMSYDAGGFVCPLLSVVKVG
jgi:hypothetical protein